MKLLKNFKNTSVATKANTSNLPFALPSNYLGYSEQQQVFSTLNFRLDEEIKDASYYGEIAQRLDACTEGDVVICTIASPGGNVTGMTTLLTAMENCQGEVIVYIEGECHSAASIIALNAPQVAVGKYANMMVHNASTFIGGKQHEIQSNWEFNKKYLENIMKDTYKYFLTEQELQKMLDGYDFWFNADEINFRLERKIQMLEKEQLKLEKEHQKKLKELRKRAKDAIQQDNEPKVEKVKSDTAAQLEELLD